MAAVAFGTGFALGVVGGAVGAVAGLAFMAASAAFFAPKVMRILIGPKTNPSTQGPTNALRTRRP